MKKRVSVMIGLIGFVLVSSMTAVAETYTLGYLPVITWAEFRVAQVKGFWEKQGVTIEFVDYAWPIDSARGGALRRFDLTPIPMAYVATYRNAGAFDTIYLGTLSIADQHKVLIVKKHLLNQNLTGHTIGSFLAESTNDFFLSSYLQTVHTTLENIHQVEMNPDDLYANFRENRLQVVLTMDSDRSLYEQAGGVCVASTHTFYEPHGLCVLKQGGVSAIPPEDIKKIMRGCVEAIQWIRNPANRQEYKTILQQYFLPDQANLSDEAFRKLIQEVKFVEPRVLLDHNQQRLHEYFAQFRTFLETDDTRVGKETLSKFTYSNVIQNQALIEILQDYEQ